MMSIGFIEGKRRPLWLENTTWICYQAPNMHSFLLFFTDTALPPCNWTAPTRNSFQPSFSPGTTTWMSSEGWDMTRSVIDFPKMHWFCMFSSPSVRKAWGCGRGESSLIMQTGAMPEQQDRRNCVPADPGEHNHPIHVDSYSSNCTGESNVSSFLLSLWTLSSIIITKPMA